MRPQLRTMQRKIMLLLGLGLSALCALVVASLWMGWEGALPPASQAISVYIDGPTNYMATNGLRATWLVITNRSQEPYLVCGPAIYIGPPPKGRFSKMSIEGFDSLAPQSCRGVMMLVPTNLAAWCALASVAPDRYRHGVGQKLQKLRNSQHDLVKGIADMSIPSVKAEKVFSETVVRP